MLVHKESRSLILRLQDPARVTTHVPCSREVTLHGKQLVQVRFGLDEARVLRNLGVDAPSPIRYFYPFPMRMPLRPYDHQVTTAEFFTLNNRGICLNDMGTGKTLSTLWAADYLMDEGVIKRAIIVCPKSTMSSVWENEVFTHLLSKRRVSVLAGDRARRLKALAEPADFYVVNHDGLKVIEKELRKRTDIDLWIIDEAAAFRNTQSKRHDLLVSLIRPTDWMWLLTGTPCPQDPTDAWGLAKLMHGSRVRPAFFRQFREQTMVQINQFKWVPKPDAFEQAYAILKPGIRFKKEDCIDLPDVTFQTRTCDLTPDQEVVYSNMLTTLVASVKGVDITAANAAVKMTKLLQVCVGTIYDEFGNGYEVDAGPRLKLCEELCEQAAHKVIIFVPFRHALDQVANHLRKRWTVATVDGRTSDSVRKQVFNDFQNSPDPRILVAHPQTTAHGLTLTAADLTIWYAPVTSLEIFEQANNRMNRPGQKNRMTIAMLAATAMEQNLYNALKGKQDVQNAVLSLFKSELGLNT